MMECKEFKEKLTQYSIDGKIDNDTLDQIEDHLATCDDCYHFFQTQTALLERLQMKDAEELVYHNAEHIVLKGIAYYNKREFEKAIKCYEEALELKPGDEKILQKLFEIMEDSSQKPHETEQYKKMPAFIIANLNGLTSDSFICKTSALGDAQYRGDAQQDQKPSKAVYTIGEPIIVSIEMPTENDGYLAVFHYDEKYNLNMLFPKETTDDTFVNSGKEIRVGLTAEEPIGRQYIKAIWTDKQAIKSAAIDFDDNESVATAIKKFLKTIYEIDEIKWLESVNDFEIIEKP